MCHLGTAFGILLSEHYDMYVSFLLLCSSIIYEENGIKITYTKDTYMELAKKLDKENRDNKDISNLTFFLYPDIEFGSEENMGKYFYDGGYRTLSDNPKDCFEFEDIFCHVGCVYKKNPEIKIGIPCACPYMIYIGQSAEYCENVNFMEQDIVSMLTWKKELESQGRFLQNIKIGIFSNCCS